MNIHFKKSIMAIGFTLMAYESALANIGGLFVEPILTYETGEADLNLPNPFNSSESTVKGLGLGVRLGVHVYESAFVGLDARYSRPTYQNSDTGVDATADAFNYGPVVGLQMPTLFGVRIWGGYIMVGEMDVERDGEVDFKFESGNGYRVGGGVKLSIVSVNLEYQDIEYDKTELSDASIFSGSTRDVVQTNKSVILSVSLPISL